MFRETSICSPPILSSQVQCMRKTSAIEVVSMLCLRFATAHENVNTQGDYDVNDYPTNCKVRYHPVKITRSTAINTVLCRSQHYHLLLTSSYSGFNVTVAVSSANYNSSEIMLSVGICNTSTILTSNTFSMRTSYSLNWNGTVQRSQLNTHYCFGISPLGIDVIAIPITIEFELMDSAVVVEYSSVSVANNVMFAIDNLLVSVRLFDQWNNSIEASVPIVDEDGENIGTFISSNELKYNATLKQGQLISTKTLYLLGVNEHYPHATFYGNISRMEWVFSTDINKTKTVISRNWLFGLLAAMTALIFGFVLYQSGRYVKARYDKMKQLVRKKEKEIELLTDLWKIDGSEIEWLEPINRGWFASPSEFRVFARCHWLNFSTQEGMGRYGNVSGESMLWQSRSFWITGSTKSGTASFKKRLSFFKRFDIPISCCFMVLVSFRYQCWFKPICIFLCSLLLMWRTGHSNTFSGDRVCSKRVGVFDSKTRAELVDMETKDVTLLGCRQRNAVLGKNIVWFMDLTTIELNMSIWI